MQEHAPCLFEKYWRRGRTNGVHITDWSHPVALDVLISYRGTFFISTSALDVRVAVLAASFDLEQSCFGFFTGLKKISQCGSSTWCKNAAAFAFEFVLCQQFGITLFLQFLDADAVMLCFNMILHRIMLKILPIDQVAFPFLLRALLSHFWHATHMLCWLSESISIPAPSK